ncbi:hypothetical protein ACFL5Z_10530 [Planctomycetota bacterium]
MRSTEKVEKLVKNLDLGMDTNAQTDQAVLSELLDAQKKSMKQDSAFVSPNIRRLIMKSPMTKLAAAAVVIIAVLIGINPFGNSKTSVVWADVIGKLDEIHSYIYHEKQSSISGSQKEGFEFVGQDWEQIVYCSQDFGRRTDNYQGEQLKFSTYVLPQKQALFSVRHSARECIRYPLGSGGFRGIDPRGMVEQILSNDYTELGRDTINGKTVEGAELHGQKISGPRLEDAVTRLWVDVETGLPVRIELEGLAYRTSTEVRIVQDQFQWNVELVAGDFNIPPDYEIIEREFPSKPEPEEVLAVVEDGKEPDMPHIGDLNLLGLDDDEPDVIVPLLDRNEIWRAQDEIVGIWPDYSDVREQLHKELSEKLDLSDLSDRQLLATAVALREQFWEAGGCLSKISYPYGYAARILLESAHNENPEDLTVTDELIETIQSVELAYKYGADSGQTIKNMALQDILTELRMAQFEQIKRELEEGRAPIWEDFVRVNDLAALLSRAGDFESAQEAAEWMIKEAERGGWAAYMAPLENMQRNFNEGKGFSYNISVATKVSFPEESRYGRRLPSFRGPQKRGTIPIHLLEKKPVWGQFKHP